MEGTQARRHAGTKVDRVFVLRFTPITITPLVPTAEDFKRAFRDKVKDLCDLWTRLEGSGGGKPPGHQNDAADAPDKPRSP